jgi:hypothetical protein
MNMSSIREQAQAVGLTATGKMRKGDLIRAIQSKEGNEPCFAAEWRVNCQQTQCLWRSDCLDKKGH